MTKSESALNVQPAGRVRWIICGLLFFATTVNYIDRQVIGILKPTLERELGWRESDFGWIVFAFQCAYAVMMPVAGRVIDWLGTRVGYALAVVVWSLASMSHAIARTSLQFAAARFALGVGESANFPAAVKTVADWFPKRERALATGIFNSGSNLGAMVAPLLVPFVAVRLGWRAAFLVTGGLDFVWVAAWLLYFRKPSDHHGVSKAELAYIDSDSGEEPAGGVRYASLLTKRAAWAFVTGKFVTDPVWWFYLFWLPGFLHASYGLNLTQLGPPLVVIYLAADAGSIAGGWLSSHLAARGWTLNRARKTAMLVCAACATPVIPLAFVGSLWPAVALICFGTAAHQGWSANLYTIASDTFPRRAVGSVVGLGGLGGAVGGMLVAPAVGYWLDFSHGSYRPLFICAGMTYLIALSIIHVMLPRLERIEL
ncbi:MAG TPA: MFS transporter [Bryobacteraceae bacterium]|nr:MFS transporter [Bryobacteraceae bacterium]